MTIRARNVSHTGFAQWVPQATVTAPRSRVVQVLRDHWWAVNEAGEVCLWRFGPGMRQVSPQANVNRAIAESCHVDGVVGAVLLPIAFVEHECDRA